MSFLSPDQAPTPAAPKVEGAPPPTNMPIGRKAKGKNQQATFLGSDMMPGGPGPASGNMGGKTLLGS